MKYKHFYDFDHIFNIIHIKFKGLSLSGCEQEASNKKLADAVKEASPTAAKSILVCSDTAGSIATAAPKGGLVIISGKSDRCIY